MAGVSIHFVLWISCSAPSPSARRDRTEPAAPAWLPGHRRRTADGDLPAGAGGVVPYAHHVSVLAHLGVQDTPGVGVQARLLPQQDHPVWRHHRPVRHVHGMFEPRGGRPYLNHASIVLAAALHHLPSWANMRLVRLPPPCFSPQVVYIPALNNLFYTHAVIGVAWLFNLGFGIFIFVYTESVKYFARRDPEGFVARHVAW